MLTERQREVKKVIEDNPTAVATERAKLLNISVRVYSRHLTHIRRQLHDSTFGRRVPAFAPVFLDCPTTPRASTPAQQRILDIIEQMPHATGAERSAALGVSTRTYRKHIQTLKKATEAPSTKLPEDESTVDEAAGTAIQSNLGDKEGFVQVRSLNIKTVKAALIEAEINPTEWTVRKATINFWDTTLGAKTAGESMNGEPRTVTNYQVKVWLDRIAPSPIHQAIQALVDKIPSLNFDIPTHDLDDSKDSYIFEVSLYDHHFGLLAWNTETGEDYDLDIARRIYLYAVDRLLMQAQPYSLKKIVLPIGNDLFHINDPTNQTPTNHNVLDTDCRLAKVFETVETTIVAAVLRCAKIAPVDILWVPGNHDPETGYYLTRVLARVFEQTDSVTVDTSPKVRKYRQFGHSLIGYTHGMEENMADLPLIMATEMPQEWTQAIAANAACEWHIGHTHKKRQRAYTAGDTYGGVHVRTIGALTGTDAWHFKKGYISTMRAAEAFLWHTEDAFAGHMEARIPRSMYADTRIRLSEKDPNISD